MRRMSCLSELSAESGPGLEFTGHDEDILQEVAGYVLEEATTCLPPESVMVWRYRVSIQKRDTLPSLRSMGRIVSLDVHSLVGRNNPPYGEPQLRMTDPVQRRFDGAHHKMVRLEPVGRLVPVAAAQPQLAMLPSVRSLRPVQSGQSYRISSPPGRGLVRPELANALETVFERFAHQCSFTSEKPLEIRLARGFKAGSPGHGEGRAADIAAVGGKSLREWKQEWDRATAASEKLSDPQQQAEPIAAEQKHNLGYTLYKALQEHGGWRVDPKGWRPYRGVMQLFGPWTPADGPWKAMQSKDPNRYQQQRMADQQRVFRAHQDHIHVAR
jgi:hypothetical protein